MIKNIEVTGLLLRNQRELLFGGNDISLVISPERLNVLLGGNGVGKTSLVELLALRSNTQVLRGTINRNRLDHPKYYAFLPQILWDIDDITLKELSILAKKSKKVMEEEHRVYLETRANRYLSLLSGGELRYCLFLLVSCQHQQVYIYDEPFLNLDPENAIEVKKVLFASVAKGNMVIVVAHRNNDFSAEDPNVNIIRLPSTC